MNKWMLSEKTYNKLVLNHREQAPLKGTPRERDFYPVCRLYLPCTDMMWLLTELDPDDEIAFGLCQIQMAELGSVWMPELADIKVHSLTIIEDTTFVPRMTLGQYARRSRENGWMIDLG